MKINFKNTPIHVETYGGGKPIILLHGFLEDSQIWNEFIPLLKKECQVICIDLFGHGKTPGLGDIHEIETMAEAVSVVMDQLSISSAKLIGHSMGGYVSMAFLEKFSEKTNGILLLNSTPAADSEQRQRERVQGIQLVKKDKKTFLDKEIIKLFAEENRKKFEKSVQHHISKANKISTDSIIATLKGMKIRKDRTLVLEKFAGTKLIVAGIKDPLIPSKSIQKIADKTQAKLISLSCGHMSYIEKKEEVKIILSNFIDLG